MKNYDDLIVRLKEKASNPKLNTDLGVNVTIYKTGEPAYLTLPPLTLDEIASAENLLGYQLPELLRRLYSEVGNGRWGFGYGFYSLIRTDAHTLDDWTVLEKVGAVKRMGWGEIKWPQNLLPLFIEGGSREYYVSCSYTELPILCVDTEYDSEDESEDDEDMGPEKKLEIALTTTITQDNYRGFYLASRSLEAALKIWAERPTVNLYHLYVP